MSSISSLWVVQVEEATVVMEDDGPVEVASAAGSLRNLAAWGISIPYVDLHDDEAKRERVPVFCIDVERHDRKDGEGVTLTVTLSLLLSHRSLYTLSLSHSLFHTFTLSLSGSLTLSLLTSHAHSLIISLTLISLSHSPTHSLLHGMDVLSTVCWPPGGAVTQLIRIHFYL